VRERVIERREKEREMCGKNREEGRKTGMERD